MLRFSDFVHDSARGIHVQPGLARDVTYLDGVEQQLARLLSQTEDLSSVSDELMAKATAWPLSYHVSPYRWTLLDALGLPGDAADVLELGAGCGAVTRWLGERFPRVTAVEGSPERAALARQRCRELSTVDVYAGNFHDLDVEPDYDVATLIGVLEYSPVFHPGSPNVRAVDAVGDTLRLARRALREHGVLVIAIENRLGLRYLLGAGEDHTGRPFEGIQGYPREGTPTTFDRAELERLIVSAGFDEVRVLLPFPDYKMPRTIVNARELRAEDRVENWLAGMGHGVGSTRGARVCRPLVTREVARSGLLEPLADSFLVLAFNGTAAESATRLGLDLDWVTRHYALARRRGLRKRLTMRRGPAGPTLEARRWPPDDGPAPPAPRFVLDETLRPGPLLVFDVLEALAAEGLGGRFLEHVREYHAWLTEVAADGCLPGDAVDLVWWNIVVDPASGRWEGIDREWDLGRRLPVDFVTWRMLRHFAVHFAECLPAWCSRSPSAFATAVLAAALPSARVDAAWTYAAADDALARTVAPGYPGVDLQAALEQLDRPVNRLARRAGRVGGQTGYAAIRASSLGQRAGRVAVHRLRLRRGRRRAAR